MKTTFILIRHAQSTAKERGLVQGRGESEPLSELGLKQIEQYAQNCTAWHIDKLFSSTSVRASETAKPLLALFPLVPYEEIESLHERSKGDAEGMQKEVFKQTYPEIEAAWEEGQDPCVPNGESIEDVETRVMPILISHKDAYEGQTLVYVIHGNVIRSIVGGILKVPFGLRGRIGCDYCSATRLTFDHERNRFEVASVNVSLL